jgi:hypothetical protein
MFTTLTSGNIELFNMKVKIANKLIFCSMQFCTTNHNELKKKWVDFVKINLHLNDNYIKWIWIEFKYIAWNPNWIELNYIESKFNSLKPISIQTILNSIKLWKFNYERAHVNLFFHMHVGGLMKGMK